MIPFRATSSSSTRSFHSLLRFLPLASFFLLHQFTQKPFTSHFSTSEYYIRLCFTYHACPIGLIVGAGVPLLPPPSLSPPLMTRSLSFFSSPCVRRPYPRFLRPPFLLYVLLPPSTFSLLSPSILPCPPPSTFHLLSSSSLLLLLLTGVLRPRCGAWAWSPRGRWE